MAIGGRLPASGFWQPQRAALRFGFHLSSDICLLLSNL
jgi:hypothetical protein